MKAKVILLLIAGCFMMVEFSYSQFNIGDKIRNATNNKINKKVDQGINKGLDNILNKKKTNQKDSIKTNGTDKATNIQSNSNAETPTLASYSKYDFIPGAKVIFYEDYSKAAVSDFPALWNTNGSAEVVTTNLFTGNWLKFSMRNSLWTDELLKLPDNYTIEFDVIPIKGEQGSMAGYSFRLLQSINAKAFDYGAVPGKSGFLFECEYYGRTGYRTYINGSEGDGLGLSGSKDEQVTYQKLNEKYHIAVWVQKSRIRLYQNETKMFDLPKAFPVESVKFDRIRFEDGAAMVSNIRIAVGAPDTRNKLMTEGKLVTYGIYFDVNKDVVKPESYGTLKDIARVLNEVPDAKVKIVGHTDSDGQDAANLDLSKRRSAAVKEELVKSFEVNANRLVTDGMGESQPVAPNDTPVNKALNRRVEFIKL